MSPLYLLCGLLLAVVSSIDAQLQTVNGRIKMSIHTTAGCADTRRFITQQLRIAHLRYGGYLDIEFIPWGKTIRNGNDLECQFGTNDCRSNRMQRCALNLLKGDQTSQIDYILCEFSEPYPAFSTGSYRCAQAQGLRLVDVDYCMHTTGDSLETVAESAAAEPMAAHFYIPNIVFNDQVNATISQEAETALLSVICLALANDSTTGVTDCPV